MLPWLDQFAFNVLLAVSSFVGIHDVPNDKNSTWTIVDHWVPQQDGSFKLSIESKNLSEECLKSPNGFVVFPSVNLSINSVYLDGALKETNSPMGSWNVSQMFYKPVIHCAYISDVKVVRQEIRAYLKYMAAITEFPKVMKPSFGFYFITSDLFYVSALVILLFTVINSILIIGANNFKKFKYSIFQDLSILAVVLFISPGKFFETSLVATNELFLSLLLIAVYLFGHLAGLVNKKRSIFFAGVIFCIYFLSKDNKNLIQLMTIVMFPFIILWLAWVGIILYRNLKFVKYDKGLYVSQLIIIAAIVVCALYDSYASSLTFNYFILLPIAYVLVSVVNFLDIIRLAGAQKFENYVLRDEIGNQISVIKKLMGSQERYQEILHDIKSPLSGLNFVLADVQSENSQMLKLIKDRLGELLTKSENVLKENAPRWISTGEVINMWSELALEYKNRVSLLITSEMIVGSDEALIDPISAKAIFSELLDNSIKASVCSVSVHVSRIHENIRIDYKNVQKLDEGILSEKRGSGKGLGFIRTRIESWGGSIDIDPDSFDSVILLKVR